MKPWNSRPIEPSDRVPAPARRTWLLWLSLGLIGAILLAACSRAAGGGVSRAGISIDPVFADFVADNGGERVFGRPITTLYREEATGRDVQYFTRMRLEAAPGQPVQITALGEWALAGLEPIDAGVTAGALVVDQTFAEFYVAFAGADLFGAPLSPQIKEGDFWVQYFENARLEWHPELTLANRVQVGPLGTAHFYGTSAVAEFEAQRKLETVNLKAVESELLALDASLSAPILFSGDEQVIYASVTTADGSRAVEDATVIVVVPNGATVRLVPLGRTKSDGTLAAPLPLPALSPGDRVDLEVQVLAEDGTVLSRAYVTFSAWW